MLGVKLLTNADQTVAALHTKKGKKKKKKKKKRKEKKERILLNFTWSTKIISALEFRHKQVP